MTSVDPHTPPRRDPGSRWLPCALDLHRRPGDAGRVLLVAGALKVVDPQASVAAVRAYELLPAGLATLVGWGLPFVEVALGLLLLSRPRHAAGGRRGAGLLMLVFIAGVASAAARGLSIDCGCFGGGGPVRAGPDRVRRRRSSGTSGCCCWPAGWSPGPQSRLSLEPVR